MLRLGLVVLTRSDDFAEALREELLAHFDVLLVAPSATGHELRITLRRRGELVLLLDRFREEYASLPRAGRRAFLQRLVDDSIIQSPSAAVAGEPFELWAPGLVPLVRPEVMGWSLATRWKDDQRAAVPALRPLTAALAIGLGRDTGEHVVLLGEGQLMAWGQSHEEVLTTALANLRERSRRPPERVSGREAFWSCVENDSIEEARILLPEWLRAGGCRDPIVGVPAVGQIVIGGAEQAGELARVVEGRFREAHRPVSAQLYRSDELGVHPYEVPSAHPHHEPLERARRVELEAWYRYQTAELDELYGEAAPALVAYRLAADASGATRGFAAWDGEAGRYLPVVDEVLIALRSPDADAGIDGAEDLAAVTWSALTNILGERLGAVRGLTPLRYRTPTITNADREAFLRATLPLDDPPL